MSAPQVRPTPGTATTASNVSAVGQRQGTFEVDSNGQATYRLMLPLPPGIAGLQPAMELVYRHGQPNGLLGVGWGLSGLSAITRIKATYAVDGFNGTVAYDANDRYVLDGQRLINVEGAYGAPGALYYTELQTWDHIRAGASQHDGFTVIMKSGETRQYGTTPDSRILAAGGQDVRVWALSTMADRNGNRVEYHYTLAPGGDGADSGAYYVDRISYTTRDDGTAANRFVQFTYEQRPDPIADFIGGYPVTLLYRLQQITVSVAGNEVVRSYTMHYRTSTATALSCIDAITESGTQSAGAPVLPPTTLVWQDVDTPGFDIGPSSTLDQHLGQADVRAMDVTGSGRTDLVQLWVDTNNAIHATTYLATPGNGGTTFVRAADSVLGAFPDTHEILPVDVDGDGRTDLLIAYQYGPDSALRLAVFLSDGAGFTSAGTFDTGDSWTEKHLRFFAMDANGDGRTDLVEAYAHYDPSMGELLYFRTYLSRFGDGSGAMFTEEIVSPTADPASPTALLAFWPMDVNGDGMMDLVRVWQRSDLSIMVTAYMSVSTTIDNTAFATQVDSNLGTFSLQNQIAFLPVDVNGDGVQDLLQIWQEPGPSGTTLHLTTFLCNAAGGFVAGPDSTFENQTLTANGLYPMDVDGSGLTALLGKWISGDNRLMFTVFRASPAGEYRALPPFDAGPAGTTVALASFFPGDVNGDGKADLIRTSYDENQQLRVVPYTSSGPYPDLVTTITNALGGSVTIAYAPLSDSDVYTAAETPAFPAAPGRRYPNPLTPTQFPSQAVLGRATYVVAQYTERNDPTRNRFQYQSTSTMAYSGARLDLLGRGWQGFQTVSSVQQESGRRTIKTYNQDFPYTGTLASTSIEADGAYATDPRVPPNEHGLLLTVTTSDYTALVRARGATGPNPAVLEVLRTASRFEQYDYGAEHFDYALGQTYAYDDYGNETLNANLGYIDPHTGAPLYPAEVVYRHRLYQNDLLPDGWALGFLRYAKDTANANDPDITQFLPGDYHLEMRTYTASTYNLATQGQWDNVHNVYLTTAYGYDAFGNRTSETKPGNLVTHYDYDPDYRTFLMRTTTPNDQQGVPLIVTYGYDPRFNVEVARADANGYIWITGLDAFGRKALRQGPVPSVHGASDPNAVTPLVTGAPELRQAFQTATVVTLESTDYLDDGAGGLYSQVQSLQSFPLDTTRDFFWNQSYADGRGRERETVLQSGQQAGNVVVLINYDGNDKPVLQSVPFFSPTAVIAEAPCATLTTYDVLGRPLTRNVPAGADGATMATTTWAYGSGGIVTLTSAAGSDTPYVEVFEHHYYDGQDQVRQVTVDPDGDSATTQFEYDPIARLMRATDPPTITNPQGVSNTITHDSLNRRQTLDNPDQNTTGDPNIEAMTYAYDVVTGWLSQQTDAAQQTTTFAYDNLGRVTSQELSDGRTIAFTYDDASANGCGRLTRVVVRTSDQAVQSQFDFVYDKYGNTSLTTLTLASEATPFVMQSVFDPQHRTVQQTFPDSSVLTRQYAFGHLVTQSLDGARTDYPLEYYSPWGKAGQAISGQGTLPGAGVVTNYTYNPSGQVYDEVVTGSAGTVLNFSYTYDLLSQLLQSRDNTGSCQSQTFTYLNRRLQTAIVPGFAAGAYDYDASGNLVGKDGVSYTYQAHFPLSGTAQGQQVYAATPDACGRTQTRTANGTTLHFNYDGLGCLQRVSTPNDVTVREMVSDYLGRLLRQIEAQGDTVLYIDPAYQITRPSQGAATVTKYLLDDRGTAAALTSSGSETSVLYFRRDFKGSNTHAFGPDGTVVTRVAYSGYGQPLTISGGSDFRPKYEQRQWDADLGLYYFGARYYDPQIGRFLTPDTQPGAHDLLRADVLNRFAFELNNPINLVDPTGHAADWIAGLLIGLAILAIGAVIILSGGAATPLAAAGAGALLGAGLNLSIYSVTHREVSGGRFWGGYVVNGVVGAVIGGVTGGLGSALGSALESATASIVSRGVQFAIRGLVYAAFGAAVTSAGDAFTQFMSNVADRYIVGEHDVSLGQGVERAAITGAIFGVVAGIGQAAGEARFLKTTYGWEELESAPVPLRAMGSTTESLPLIEREYIRPDTRLMNTLKSRFVLFGISEASLVADASLEAAGY